MTFTAGKSKGQRGVGRRKRMTDGLHLIPCKEWTGIHSAKKLFRLVVNWEAFSKVIVNLCRNEHTT